MAEPSHPLRRTDRVGILVLVLAVAAIGFLIWWSGMADASMTGCGGG